MPTRITQFMDEGCGINITSASLIRRSYEPISARKQE